MSEVFVGEPVRGCGHRKVGGLYLIGGDVWGVCDRIPWELRPCEICGSELRFHRGFQLIDWRKFGKTHNEELDHLQLKLVACTCTFNCYFCNPPIDEKFGFMWVGEKFYTPQSFSKEACQLGISKRISQIPKGIEFGKTKVLLAHKKGYQNEKPGIFTVFVVQRIEKLIKKSQATDEVLKDLEHNKITPVIVDDVDCRDENEEIE